MAEPAVLDLSTVADLHTYLSGSPFESKTITPISGGYTNFSFRLALVTPYRGRSTLVAKHAKGYVIVSGREVPITLSRQSFEVEALNRVSGISSTGGLVKVPVVHRFDNEANVIIMDDAGEGSVTLKRFAQDGGLTLSLAEIIGRGLGEFLGNLHVWGAHNQPILDLFGKHEEAGAIVASVYYGRLVSTLSDKVDLPALQDPPLEVPAEKMEIMKKLAAERTLAMTSAKDDFVMGDFWPGNILITPNEEGALESIHVVDWEVARIGIPALDVGQFCAEMDLLRRFHPETEQSAGKTISTFLETYSGICHPDISFARMAIAHWGVHLVAWTPRIPWGGKEKTRETVEAGVELSTQGYSGPDEWVKGSEMRRLIS